MSYQKQEYTNISNLLLKGTGFPTNIGSYEGQHTQPCSPGDPITIGDTVEVKTSTEKLLITVEVELVCSKSIHGRIDNVHGNEHQDLPLDAKVEIFNEYILCVFRKK